MCSALGVAPAAFAATVDSVNTDNLAVPPVEGKTLIYTDTAGTASFGWLDPVNDSGEIGLGISVYNEAFNGTIDEQVYQFAGCIMAQPDLEVNCQAPGDSGKRFKLKTTETNGPIDLVFNVSADDASKLYRVIGKFSNLTDTTNLVEGGLKAFRIETGFGVGNDFTPSSAEDGLSFGMAADGASKLSIGPIGKYPGGLFGGSRVEGLPFFSTSIAAFTEGTTASDEDTMETDGVIPVEYSELFGDWNALANVPTGWFIDHDGNPANDSILLAWNDGTDWQTNEKTFEAVDIEAILLAGGTETAPATIYDPNGTSFDAEGENTTIYDLSNVRPVVDTLDEGDPDNIVPAALSLSKLLASELYDGTFRVLIDGEAVTIADFETWADNPPTVEDTTDGSTLATWLPDAGDEGLYELADGSTMTLEDMNEMINASEGELVRVAGYVQGPVEDLANVNLNTTISVADTASWPTCTSDGTETSCTFTMRVTGLNELVDDPAIPATPATPASRSSSSGGGCTVGGPGSPFDPVLPGMVLLALAGLWARKRRADA
ncbi:choice-of-anchor F family protein [Marinobacter sp. AN1]|uniref:choice-of-anchor F family protein n=1 Tax=Marinobacter sp. AN1 TaxID=2886046 RepID=UPI00222F9084|nr:choice-of-anchor F family protein [Marinobacter sp. AN1]UZD64320.1 choice-of-anchor F family protein [Marinobacter sp. AN1]